MTAAFSPRSSRLLSGLARITWMLVSLVALAAYALSTVTLSAELRKPCDLENRPEECNSLEAAGLQELGISRTFYTNMLTAGVVLEVLPWFIAGTILFWKRSKDLYSVVLSLSMITMVLALLDQGILTWAAWRLPDYAWVVDGLTIVGQLASLAWVLFPNERRLTFGLLLFAFYLFANTIGAFFFPGTPLDNGTWPNFLELVHWGAVVVIFLSIFTSRYRSSPPTVRQQIKWVVWAFALLGMAHLFVRIAFTVANTGTAIILLRLTLVPFSYLASGLAAFAVLAAMLRYRLFDIDILIRRTFSYAVLTAVLAATYFGGVVVLQNLFGRLAGDPDSPIITVATTLAIAALFNSLRTRIQGFIDRRFYRAKYDAEASLERFALAARDEVDMETLSGALLKVVREAIQPERVSLWLNQADKI